MNSLEEAAKELMGKLTARWTDSSDYQKDYEIMMKYLDMAMQEGWDRREIGGVLEKANK